MASERFLGPTGQRCSLQLQKAEITAGSPEVFLLQNDRWSRQAIARNVPRQLVGKDRLPG